MANANTFAHATWIVRRVERDAMFSEKPRPASYAALRHSKTILLSDDDHDVFGDGSVVIKLTAGHTPAIRFYLSNYRKRAASVLSGDLYHFPEMRRLNRVATFDFTQSQTPVTRSAIEEFLKTTGAQLWIQHDYIGSTRLKKAPAYYE